MVYYIYFFVAYGCEFSCKFYRIFEVIWFDAWVKQEDFIFPGWRSVDGLPEYCQKNRREKLDRNKKSQSVQNDVGTREYWKREFKRCC